MAKSPFKHHPFYGRVWLAFRRYRGVSLDIAMSVTKTPLEAFCVFVAYEAVKKHHPENYHEILMVGSYLKRLEMAHQLFS